MVITLLIAFFSTSISITSFKCNVNLTDSTNTLDFIDLSSASMSLPSSDDGSSSAIDIPESGFPMGSQSFFSVYVRPPYNV